jgi:hypothetical protein
MTIIYIILILLQAAVIVYFIRQGRKKTVNAHVAPAADTYEGLRNLAVNVTPEQLKLTIPDDRLFVFGVIMDWNMGEAIVSLAAYVTGAANMYFNTGEGITGGGKNPIVGEAAVAFVVAAQDYVERGISVSTADLPTRGCVRFHLLTNHGIYAMQEQIKHIQDGTSPYIPLFESGNKVMTEMQAGGVGNYKDITLN